MNGERTEIKCLECGARFKRTITAHTFEIPCPKCKGVDTEVA